MQTNPIVLRRLPDRKARREPGRALDGPGTDPLRTWVCPGLYDLQLVDCTLRTRWRRDVFDLTFQIVDGPKGSAGNCFEGRRLRRYVSRPKETTRGALRGGYASDFRKIVGLHPPRRLRSVDPQDVYGGVVLEGVVRTVERDHHGDPVPEGARYSVVARIRRLVAGTPGYLRRREG